MSNFQKRTIFRIITTVVALAVLPLLVLFLSKYPQQTYVCLGCLVAVAILAIVSLTVVRTGERIVFLYRIRAFLSQEQYDRYIYLERKVQHGTSSLSDRTELRELKRFIKKKFSKQELVRASKSTTPT